MMGGDGALNQRRNRAAWTVLLARTAIRLPIRAQEKGNVP